MSPSPEFARGVKELRKAFLAAAAKFCQVRRQVREDERRGYIAGYALIGYSDLMQDAYDAWQKALNHDSSG